MAKETLWSMSTTIREAERIMGFLQTAAILDGKEWDKENQCKFQILLIKNHEYLNNTDSTQVRNRLNEKQIEALSAWDKEMSYEMAESIFRAKQYVDPEMRGRQSMSPLIKLGLAYYYNKNGGKKLYISDMGKKLLSGEITFEEMILDALLKYQYPNPSDKGFNNWNTKPFINTLRLIKRVNEICEQKGEKAKGISTREFGIFALSLKNYFDIENVANAILSYRKEVSLLSNEKEKEKFTKSFIESHLADFNNPVKNCKEYTDNMIRYLRLTKYIYIRGKYNHTYIDLEPRRMTEINAILAQDKGEAKTFTLDEWNSYMGVYGSYKLPFETKDALTKIAEDLSKEIIELEQSLNIQRAEKEVPKTINSLKDYIRSQREYRTQLQNLLIKHSVHHDSSKIDEVIESLNDILQHNTAKLAKKLSIELEKWTNIALNILNDAKLIKPNFPVGDDNEPIYTAPSGVPDIECYYENFNSICEVTMLRSRDQWYNEGQPVMRHLRDFENKNSNQPSYCLFVAPALHIDTVNTFYFSVKYEYEGKKQNIIPITIKQLILILKTVKTILKKKKVFRHDEIKRLYDSCTDMSQINKSTDWLTSIEFNINKWANNFI